MFTVGVSVVLVGLDHLPMLNGRVGILNEFFSDACAGVSLRDAFSNEILFWQTEHAPQIAVVRVNTVNLKLHTTAVLDPNLPKRPVWRKRKVRLGKK